ncbi:hypothetical protein LP085_08135 [Achromobacter sp. MY14]|uniref:RepB family protein n=1 Tax=unclassified Achromobacter TaxID=2626865 RepID=UPI001E2E9DF7|nr:RepB family protein [Achromobacter sp. MY14]MCD0496815.1 hypothetical protein [Achromobacter sp. MY14]
MIDTQARIGRPKTSPLSRKEQVALAQQRKRDADKLAGLKPLNVNISKEAKGFADALCSIHNLTQKELIERLLDKAMRQGSLLA